MCRAGRRRRPAPKRPVTICKHRLPRRRLQLRQARRQRRRAGSVGAAAGCCGSAGCVNRPKRRAGYTRCRTARMRRSTSAVRWRGRARAPGSRIARASALLPQVRWGVQCRRPERGRPPLRRHPSRSPGRPPRPRTRRSRRNLLRCSPPGRGPPPHRHAPSQAWRSRWARQSQVAARRALPSWSRAADRRPRKLWARRRSPE
mmetsp:Transcript_25460/g.77314  ORF Transcript_25460/g.77314 Transcript_25460/m.77314 type:complete len:202 (+) Transcript_25460:3451-4056(+)|eukprot:scaffold75216_cov28-Tisochrysis_lutea.AAC.6